MKEAIPTEWKLHFGRDGGWYGHAEKPLSACTVSIKTSDTLIYRYPTFDDCYNVLLERIKLYESGVQQ